MNLWFQPVAALLVEGCVRYGRGWPYTRTGSTYRIAQDLHRGMTRAKKSERSLAFFIIKSLWICHCVTISCSLTLPIPLCLGEELIYLVSSAYTPRVLLAPIGRAVSNSKVPWTSAVRLTRTA